MGATPDGLEIPAGWTQIADVGWRYPPLAADTGTACLCGRGVPSLNPGRCAETRSGFFLPGRDGDSR